MPAAIWRIIAHRATVQSFIFMKSPLFNSVCSLAILATSGVSFAQTAATVPVGVMSYSFPATSQLTSTQISVPLMASPVFAGKTSAVAANSVTLASSAFQAGEFAATGSPHYLRITSGAQSGRMLLILSNTADTITVDVSDNSSQATNLTQANFSVAVGDSAQIVPGDTLATFFGDNSQGNPLAFAGAASALSADTIGIYNRISLKNDIYFYNTNLGRWVLNGSTANVGNTVILHPHSSITITRRSGRPATSIAVLGEVPAIPPLTKTSGGGQVVYSSTRYPVDMTLGSLSFSNWTQSNSALSADTVSIYNPTILKNDVYYKRLDNSWRKVGDAANDQTATVIPAGSAIVLLKRASVANASSFLSSPLPYNLN